jgi:hypothetical protein
MALSHPRVRSHALASERGEDAVGVLQRSRRVVRRPELVHRGCVDVVLEIKLVHEAQQLVGSEELIDQRLLDRGVVDVDLEQYKVLRSRDTPDVVQRIVRVPGLGVDRNVIPVIHGLELGGNTAPHIGGGVLLRFPRVDSVPLDTPRRVRVHEPRLARAANTGIVRAGAKVKVERFGCGGFPGHVPAGHQEVLITRVRIALQAHERAARQPRQRLYKVRHHLARAVVSKHKVREDCSGEGFFCLSRRVRHPCLNLCRLPVGLGADVLLQCGDVLGPVPLVWRRSVSLKLPMALCGLHASVVDPCQYMMEFRAHESHIEKNQEPHTACAGEKT